MNEGVLMAYPGNITGIQGIGSSGNTTELELLAVIELLALLLAAREQGGTGNSIVTGNGGAPSGVGGTPVYGGTPCGGTSGGIDTTGLSPLGQNLVPAHNGVPVVTSQDKQQAIIDYLQNHASFSGPQDAQFLVNSLENLSPGELNLLFQEGTTYKFTSNDPAFQQNSNVLGYEEGLNANGERTNPQIVINESFVQKEAQSNPTVVEQDILHETTHALDAGVATALNLPTEFASTSNSNTMNALQDYKTLQANGGVTWDNTATDPTGKYPIISTEPTGSDLIADAGKIFFLGGGAEIAQQDPQTYQALIDVISAANSIGNQLAGLG